jgi:hypothetical protein
MVGSDAPAMLAQPRFELGDQLRHGRLYCRRSGPANAEFDKVPAKEPRAENGVVVATATPRARTATGAQVLGERRQIDVARPCAMLGHDMADMSGRPQISHCRRGTIALPFKRRCEAVEVRSAWPVPQMPQYLRCRKVCLQHVRPRLRPAIGGQADGAAGAHCYGDKKRRDSQKNAAISCPTPHYRICP